MFTSTHMKFISNNNASRPKILAEIVIIGYIDLNYKLEPADIEYELLEPIDMDLETIHIDYDLEAVLYNEIEDLDVYYEAEIINMSKILESEETTDAELKLEFICMGIAFMCIEDDEIEIDWDDL